MIKRLEQPLNSVCRQQEGVEHSHETYRDGRGIDRLGQYIDYDMNHELEQDAVFALTRQRLAALVTEAKDPPRMALSSFLKAMQAKTRNRPCML